MFIGKRTLWTDRTSKKFPCGHSVRAMMKNRINAKINLLYSYFCICVFTFTYKN
ncbi:unnamed protein product, partial [Nesidiocoris tenuis]